MFARIKKSGKYQYLQIVENRKEGKKVKQRVLATIGRMDRLQTKGQGGDTLGERDFSKDHRSDLNQMVVGAVIDDNGKPLCCEIWPGNTADVTALIPVVDKVRKRFGIGRFCIVAVRGMISADNSKKLEDRQIPYILGARMRRVKDIKMDVLSRPGRYNEVYRERESKNDP